MLSVLEEGEEVILEKYLELSIFTHFDCRGTRLVGDEGDLSEESSRLKYSDFLSSLDDAELPLDDIVRTPIRRITYCHNTLPCFTILRLTHEEEI